MDQKSEAEELLRALTQLTHHPELEPTEQLARGEGALLWYLAKGHDGATAGAMREVLADGSGRVANVPKSLEAKELITREKKKYARGLIENTTQPIGNIAIPCGYDSFAYFSKVYNPTYGVRPRVDRK